MGIPLRARKEETYLQNTWMTGLPLVLDQRIEDACAGAQIRTEVLAVVSWDLNLFLHVTYRVPKMPMRPGYCRNNQKQKNRLAILCLNGFPVKNSGGITASICRKECRMSD